MNTFDDLLQRYHQIELEKREATSILAVQMDELKAQMEIVMSKLSSARQPFEAVQAELMDKIRPLAEALLKDAKKKNYPFPGGKVKYRSGYINYSWNTQGLIGLSKAHPEIMSLCEEKSVSALVTIELD